VGPLSWIILGFLAGTLAGMATGARREGCITRIAVGVVGALVGGALAKAAGLKGVTYDHVGLRSVLVATAGAALLLLVLQAISGGRASRR
jgi:uncharacterized membrane protein YeaQ/YmgE (transglycosylase-associated protein family)